MRKPLVIAFVSVVALSGCGGDEPATTADPTIAPHPIVKAGFAADVAERIDTMAAAKDCAGLQKEFDQFDANQELNRDRGRSSADAMTYLDEAMKNAGC